MSWDWLSAERKRMQELKKENQRLREALYWVQRQCEKPGNRSAKTLLQQCKMLDHIHEHINAALGDKQ